MLSIKSKNSNAYLKAGKYIIPQRRAKARVPNPWNPSLLITKPRMRTTLPYVEALNRGGALTDDYIFRINSIHDPNFTGGGHQPMGHDEWNALYNRYRVIAVRFEVGFANTSTSPIEVTVSPSTGYGSMGLLSSGEHPFAQRWLVGGTSGNSTHRFTGVVRMTDLLGRTDANLAAASETGAEFGNNPVEGAYLHIFGASVDGTNISYNIVVRLFFDVILSDRLELGLS